MVSDVFQTKHKEPGNTRGAAHLLSVGKHNVQSTAAKEELEAMGGVLSSRINDNMNCQWGIFLVT